MRHITARQIVMQCPHLTRSCALTVPSREADTTAEAFGVKRTAVTGASCSLKVTKQNPLVVDHSFTCFGRVDSRGREYTNKKTTRSK